MSSSKENIIQRFEICLEMMFLIGILLCYSNNATDNTYINNSKIKVTISV